MASTRRAPHKLADLSPREVDMIVIKYRRALHSHARAMAGCDPQAAAAAQAALETVLGTLRELAEIGPVEKCAKVLALIARWSN